MCLFISIPRLLESERSSNAARALRWSVYQEGLFRGSFRTVPRHQNHARTGQHTSSVDTRAYYPAHTSRVTIRYARGVSQASFGQYQGTGNTPRQIDTQVPRPQRHNGLPTSPEPQSGSYSPNVSPQAIFGRHQGTASIVPNIRALRPRGYGGLPTV